MEASARKAALRRIENVIAALAQGLGNALAMMRDQAALVGGTFTVTTVRDEGCRIELRVPLRSADADGGDP